MASGDLGESSDLGMRGNHELGGEKGLGGILLGFHSRVFPAQVWAEAPCPFPSYLPSTINQRKRLTPKPPNSYQDSIP